ncbi:MAG: vipC [Devosia sp.]|nr:vipC [Devosia sp.]
MGTADRELPNIAVIGSCRVYAPLKAVHGGNSVGRVTVLFGHVHNPVEINQALDLLGGSKSVPSVYAPLLSIGNTKPFDGRDLLAARLKGCDVVVVELSSVRTIAFDNWQLQKNHFDSAAIKSGVSRRQLSALFKSNVDTARDGIAKVLPDGALLQRIIREATFEELPADRIDAEIATLAERFTQPVLFVGFVERDSLDQPIPQRVLLNSRLAAYVEAHQRHDFFNPTSLVETHGFATVMKDLGHYNPSFIPTVGAALAERAQALAARTKQPAGAQPAQGIAHSPR